MKNKPLLATSTVCLMTTMSTLAQGGLRPSAHGDPYIPVGTLAVNSTVVTTGVKPSLTWNIEYPTVFEDLAIIGNTGALSTTQQVDAEIRILGVSFQNDETGRDLPVALWVRVGGEGNEWQPLFSGKATDVDPSKVLYEETINPGKTIDIAARGQGPSGSWQHIVWTVDSTNMLENATNGTPVPDSIRSVAGEFEDFTSALLTEDETQISIGPKDMVYFFELSSSDPNESSFDLQDVVALVQFKGKNNNGHGNNIDGVDVSNPGKSMVGAGSKYPYTLWDADGNEVDAFGNLEIAVGSEVYIDDEIKTLK